MVISVEVGEKTSSRLEDLQALIELGTGKKVTRQRLVEMFVEQAYASREEVVDRFREDWEGLSPEEAKRWASWAFSEGEPVGEEDVDSAIYGGSA